MDRPFPVARSVVVVASLVLAVCLALRCCTFATLYDGDMELFVYMGKILGEGGRIGIELIDNKLPTVSLIMWLPYQLIGAWWPGYAILSVVLACVGVLATARAAGLAQRSALWPTTVMAAAWMSFPLAVFSAFKLEHLTVPLSALAAWAFVRCCRHRSTTDAVLVGLLAGVGALAKPNALSVLAAAGLVVLTWSAISRKDRIRLAAAMAVGVAIPAAVVVVYLVHSGAITALPSVYAQIRSYNRNSVWQPELVVAKVLALGFVFGMPMFMRAFGERRWAEPAENLRGIVFRFAIVWLVLEIIGIAMQGRMYGYHFLPLAAPAALVFGLIPRRAMALPLAAGVTPVLMASLFWAFGAMLATRVPAERLAAIDYVKSHASPGDAVWMDEYARLLVESGLKPGSRIPLSFIFSNDDDAPAKFGGIVREDFRARRPKFVVLPADVSAWTKQISERNVEYATRPTRAKAFIAEWHAIEAAVTADYVPVKTFGGHAVYERRDAVAQTPAD